MKISNCVTKVLFICIVIVATGTAVAAAAEAGGGSKANHVTAFHVPTGERQLFLDNYGIASIRDLTRTMHKPTKKGAVICPDPVKGGSFWIHTAPFRVPEEKVFKLLVGSTTGPTRWYESVDGLRWTAGQKSNQEGFSVVYDTRDPDPARRYKGLSPDTWHGDSWHGECTGGFYVSPDGIDWTRIKFPGVPSQDMHSLSFDERGRMFLLVAKRRGLYGRAHGLLTSTDFENWTDHGLMFHADELDQELNREANTARMAEIVADPRLAETAFYEEGNYNVDIYHTSMFRYESHYLAMPAIHPSRTMDLTDESDNIAFKMVQLMCSRDMLNWTRLGDREDFIGMSPPGNDAADLSQEIFPSSCPVTYPPSSPVVREDELWFYYNATRGGVGWPPKKQFQPSMKNWKYSRPDRSAICLAVLRRDGFISLDAGEKQGTIQTEVFKLPDGKLLVNVNATEGALLIEALDHSGKVLAASAPMKGDLLREEVKWRKGDLGRLKDKAISLRFTLRNASLYSYWTDRDSDFRAT